MKNNFKIFLLLSLFTLLGSSGQAQVLCQPSFDNGCSSWHTRSIWLGNFYWSAPSQCTTSDFQTDTIQLTSGHIVEAVIQSGNWCGIGLWFDFNKNGDYDSTENVFHKYGGSQIHTYNFAFTLADTLPKGVYPIRLVSGWGTDCYTENTNGFGPCGIYQYGNFQDFFVKVASTTSIGKAKEPGLLPLELRPDGTDKLFIKGSNEIQSLSVYSSEGKLILKETIPAEGLSLNISHLPAGIYHFRSEGGNQLRSASWMNRK